MDALPPDLDLLLALDVFLDERHITRAARRLGITQGAASQRLARLRDFFGDALLVPGRPLLLATPRAQAIAGPLARALADLRAAIAVGAPFEPEQSSRRFVLLGNDIVEVLALPPLLKVVAKEAPSVTFSVERLDVDFAARLEQGTADLAFVPQFLVRGSLKHLALPVEPFVVILRKDHPARRRLTLERYLELGHVLIAPRGTPGSIVDTALEKLGKKRQVVVRVQHFMSAPALTASSDLVVTCPAAIFRAARDRFPIAMTPAPAELRLDHDRASVVWHERAQDDPGHRWLRKHIEHFLRRPAR